MPAFTSVLRKTSTMINHIKVVFLLIILDVLLIYSFEKKEEKRKRKKTLIWSIVTHFSFRNLVAKVHPLLD